MRDSRRNYWGIALAAGCALALSVTTASAASLQVVTYTGNDCPNVFGTTGPGGGFDSCSVDGSPIVITFNNAGAVDEVNSLFDTIDGTEFDFDPDLAGTLDTGTFAYTPNDPEDPAIRFWVAKGGSGFILHYWGDAGDLSSAEPIVAGEYYDWFAPAGSTISHMSFYDTGWPTNEEPPTEEPAEPSPEPMSLALFGLALVGAAYRRRARQ